MAMIAATQQAVTRRIRWTINRDLIKQLFVLLTLVGMLAGIVLDRAATSPALLLAVHVATYVFGGTFAVLAIAAAIRRRQIEVDLLMVLAALGARMLMPGLRALSCYFSFP